ncbi:uncharacterized protein LOC131325953 [Rhododendron vialii]|uniref:uncharacterized protein LOC131325953 n=1 Tax=Rhododendron vialii TaxID=182163 RepID=UPI00265F61A9|nr:uncharacterized protein LOC131325953 [Rhododendron vialii]
MAIETRERGSHTTTTGDDASHLHRRPRLPSPPATTLPTSTTRTQPQRYPPPETATTTSWEIRRCYPTTKAHPFLKDKRKFVYNVCANCNHLVITEQAVCNIIAETLTTQIFLEG